MQICPSSGTPSSSTCAPSGPGRAARSQWGGQSGSDLGVTIPPLGGLRPHLTRWRACVSDVDRYHCASTTSVPWRIVAPPVTHLDGLLGLVHRLDDLQQPILARPTLLPPRGRKRRRRRRRCHKRQCRRRRCCRRRWAEGGHAGGLTSYDAYAAYLWVDPAFNCVVHSAPAACYPGGPKPTGTLWWEGLAPTTVSTRA